jgi:TrmH family RNA methyltransferase
MITSLKNPKIQWVRRLQNKGKIRQSEGVFVLEGVRLIEEGLNSDWKVNSIFYTDNLGARGRNLIGNYQARGMQIEEVSENVMRSISDTESPQGILGVFEMREMPIPKALDLILVLDQIREPGNLGTILRSAEAAGVQAIFLTQGTVDPFSPKVLRAGMGAHFRIPVRNVPWGEIESHVKSFGLYTYLASVDDGEIYYRANFRRPLTLIMGGEAQGASQFAYEISDGIIHIPMPGGSDSLNVSVATGILLFEIVRQREMS